MEQSEAKELVLIVDDQATHRQKLRLAIENLGYKTVLAVDGNDALHKLRTSDIDLVLLDIIMPDVDGFDVMEFMQRDKKLREIPVIVISALDSEMDSVVRAIEFGARDFLPKNFDPIFLRARVETSLESKRNRDREIEHLQQVERLTDAAAVLEKHNVNPSRLQLVDMREREDALGKLARVFTDMASQVYEREQRLRQQVRTLRGIGLLLAVGAVYGLGIPISRIASEQSSNAFGIALWVNVISAFICLSISFYRGRVPKLNKDTLILFGFWGCFGTLFGEVVLFKVAAHVEASLIALILVAEGFIVFAFAAAMRIEKASIRRLLGFAVGFVGMLLVIFAARNIEGNSLGIWVLAGLVIPTAYACRTILLTLKFTNDLDLMGAVGFSCVSGSIIVMPFVIATGDWVSLNSIGNLGSNSLLFAILLLAIITASGSALRATLIKSTGAVFASQASLVTTLAGIIWSMLLLGEQLPPIGWLALIFMLGGAYLIGPKEEAEEVDPLTKLDYEL
ncbi:MAG: response regulator [Gammaproteobacteria bacterium]|nr:response regulator [Gammaproteobacteria bacterium]